MCDYGRGHYEWMNRGDRLEAPVARESGRGVAMGWSEALEALKTRLQAASGGVKAVVSPYWSNEDIGAVVDLMDALGGGEMVYRSPRAEDESVLPGFPNLARRRDLAPNTTGLEALGASRVGDDGAKGGLEDIAAHSGVLLVLGDGLVDVAEGFAESAELTVYLGAFESAALADADFALPITTFAEQEGTFTNHEGRVQRFWPGLQAPGAARPAWLVLGALAGAISEHEAPIRADEAFQTLRSRSTLFEGLSYESLGTRGARAGEPATVSGD